MSCFFYNINNHFMSYLHWSVCNSNNHLVSENNIYTQLGKSPRGYVETFDLTMIPFSIIVHLLQCSVHCSATVQCHSPKIVYTSLSKFFFWLSFYCPFILDTCTRRPSFIPFFFVSMFLFQNSCSCSFMFNQVRSSLSNE